MLPGIQISSLKPLLLTEDQVRDAFFKIRAMGCSTVQLQWIDPSVPVDSIARALRDADLTSVSVQDFYETIRGNRTHYIDLNRKTGGTWMCVSRIPERLKTRSGLDQYIDELRTFQSELEDFGQKLCLHPVSADFEPIEGINPVEYLLKRMPEMDICLDLYHLNKRGFHMPEWIEAYAARICMVHFKDEANGRLVPAGQGDTDWRGVVQACLRAHVPYAFVEQEKWERDPFECLDEALLWLNREIRKSSPIESLTISLAQPCARYLASYSEACREYARHDVASYSFTDPASCDVFEKFDNYRAERNLPANRVGAHYWWLVDTQRNHFIGEICIRHRLNDALEKCGGHIGYGVRPSEWNRGYGTLMLSLVLEKARKLGLSDLLITCNDENKASARVMEKNGFTLQDKIETASGEKTILIRRYRKAL